MSVVEAAKKKMELTIATDLAPALQQIAADQKAIREKQEAMSEKQEAIREKQEAMSEKQEAMSEKQEAMSEKQDAIANDSQMAVRVMLTPKLGTTHVRDSSFRQLVYQHQADYVAKNGCIVLSQKFPETAKSMGFGPTIADHILPPNETAMFHELKMVRDDPQNGLPLLDHIEKLYGRGLISFMPVSSQGPRMQLQMLVAQSIQDEYLQCDVRSKPPSWVQVHHLEAIPWQTYPSCVMLGALHGFCFYVNKIFLRSLFLRANAVHKISPDLPDPSATPEKFEECPSLKAKLGAFFASQEEGAQSIDPPDPERDSSNAS
ncbi:unnamed protein product [Symbiodinium necroappetens]|uniref:HNH nuclease domain-containing protein n=1 Tax=Symbiodinium necroappetens TaxID=1628268 RepID=A0A813BBW0_9DINO|nr:unnamed protein product [Symbiodinium necroappetens]